MIENPLKEITPPARISADFINTIIRRIESTKPIAGIGVIANQQPNGIELRVRSLVAEGEDGEAKLITLNVCKNGSPSTIRVFGYDS